MYHGAKAEYRGDLMATIEGLGAIFYQQVPKTGSKGQTVHANVRKAPVEQAPPPELFGSGPVEPRENLPQQKTSESGPIPQVKESSQPVPQREQMTTSELQEILHRVNLSIDLFEIQTSYTIDPETGDVTIRIVNQSTGEVIRSIPPYEVNAMVQLLKTNSQGGNDGTAVPLMTDIKV
jgi:uncharacterized FlaG/YvyC family protein